MSKIWSQASKLQCPIGAARRWLKGRGAERAPLESERSAWGRSCGIQQRTTLLHHHPLVVRASCLHHERARHAGPSGDPGLQHSNELLILIIIRNRLSAPDHSESNEGYSLFVIHLLDKQEHSRGDPALAKFRSAKYRVKKLHPVHQLVSEYSCRKTLNSKL